MQTVLAAPHPARISFLFAACLLCLTALTLAAAPAGAQLTFVSLSSFTGTNGDDPDASLVEGSDGNFYGTTAGGGSFEVGTAFKVSSSGAVTTLVNFTGTNGSYPYDSLVQGSDGNFYGTTEYGGIGWNGSESSGYGTVFKISPTGTLTTLYAFSAPNPGGYTNSDGYYPHAGLVEGSDGDFYGTTGDGGSSANGTVFKITTAGILTTLVDFTGPLGAYPYAGNGSLPVAPLVQGSDGNFYGTTLLGGSANRGTVFKVTSTGALTTLHNFSSEDPNPPYGNNGGSRPTTALILSNDGNFYGTTGAGGSSGVGTVFKITPAGVFTTLVDFDNTNGANPQAALIRGNDGNFYGTTVSGGMPDGTPPEGYGTVFKMSPSGDLTTLVLFNGSDGTQPIGGLCLGSDGNFYGTTSIGSGTTDHGTIFGLFGPPTTYGASKSTLENTPVSFAIAFSDPSGKGVTSIAFPAKPSHGTLTAGAITETGTTGTVALTYTPATNYAGPDSFTYTVTGYVGTSAPQTVTLNTTQAAQTITGFTPASGPVGTVITINGANLNGVTAVRFHNASAKTFSANGAGTQLAVTVPSGAGTGTITVTTPTGSVKTATSFTVTIPPTITSFTPTSGPVGTVVTVTGTNLNGVTAVRFHNASAKTFSANGAGTQLTVTVPSGAATGTITVTTPGGSVKTATPFTVH